MIKAIIFDCFGVLTTDAWIAFKKKYFRNDRDLAAKASSINHLAGTGEISYSDFLGQISGLAGIPLAKAKEEINTNVADEELFEYIRQLKPKYKIGLLSNTAANHLSRLFSQDQIALFDDVVLSYEHEVIKPDIRAYQLIADRLKVRPEECVFVDNQEKHCAGARRAGMRPILYKDFRQMKSELDIILNSSSGR